MQVYKIKDVYNVTRYVRKDDYEREKRRGKPTIKVCKRNGAYHDDAWMQDKVPRNRQPIRLIHKDNIAEMSLIESA